MSTRVADPLTALLLAVLALTGAGVATLRGHGSAAMIAAIAGVVAAIGLSGST